MLFPWFGRGNVNEQRRKIWDELNDGVRQLDLTRAWDQGYGFGVMDQMDGLRLHQNPYRSES